MSFFVFIIKIFKRNFFKYAIIDDIYDSVDSN